MFWGASEEYFFLCANIQTILVWVFFFFLASILF